MTAIARRRACHAGPILRFFRRCWAALERALGSGSTCDQCGRTMLDYSELHPGERICIRCVAERARRRESLAAPELAGCAAVLRALLLELDAAAVHLGSATHTPRMRELVDLAINIAWWMTPRNLRIPSQHDIDEMVLFQQLAAYEDRWALVTGTRSLDATYRCWRVMQLKAAQYAELAEVDRRYAAMRGADDTSALPRATHRGSSTCPT